jgi:hypothetical protein
MKKTSRFTLFSFLFYNFCLSQVPVSMEPRHHNVFENGHIRLLDVHIPAGDTTRMHIHATPSVFVILGNVNTGSQVISEEDRSSIPIAHYGNIWFEGFYTKPRIHRVWNRDTSEFRVMDIELTNKSYMVLDSPVKQASLTFLFDEKPVRAYRLNLQPLTNITVSASKADILMILLTDSVESIRINEKSFHKKGDFLYIPSGTAIEIKNGGTPKAVFAFFELK